MEQNAEPQPTPQHPNQISLILWWFSTSISEIIKDCKSDANRAKIIGLGVLFTFLYATIAWIYFWSISVSNPWLFVPLGLFMGFGILTIDRMLISSIKSGKINIVPTIFRVLLALALGTFIAQPIVLWMFDEDLQGEIKVLNDEKIEERNQILLGIKASESATLLGQKESLEAGLESKYADVQAARESYSGEIDGTGGSKRFGIKAVAKEKGKILDRLEGEYLELKTSIQPMLDSVTTQLAGIERKYLADFNEFNDNYANSGFLIHVEALQSLLQKDVTGSLKERYYLLLIILILFELVPIISKIFLPTGSYDMKVALMEEMETRTYTSDFERDISTHESYNNGTKKQDLKLLMEFFKKSDGPKSERIDEILKKWSSQNGKNEGDLWQQVKKEVMNSE
ncbi:MAG: DUF4407 domain-containing protein [Cytophagales bacterium]|nr:DUF4407 domain-containing protein [Cytophagales bacterium]